MSPRSSVMRVYTRNKVSDNKKLERQPLRVAVRMPAKSSSEDAS